MVFHLKVEPRIGILDPVFSKALFLKGMLMFTRMISKQKGTHNFNLLSQTGNLHLLKKWRSGNLRKQQ
jgi:hypothetical protein